MSNVALATAVVLAFAVVGLSIWLLPRLQARGWRRAGISDATKLAELSVQARTGITQAFGGLALIATLAITAYQVNQTQRSSENNLKLADENFQLAERGQVSERFSRAVEQLGATNTDAKRTPALDVRIGALFSLRRIALDSKEKENTPQAFLVVATYIGNNYKVPYLKPRHKPDGCGEFSPVRADVRTALTSVLPDLAELLEKRGVEPPLGLRGAVLDQIAVDDLDFESLNLTQIKLRYAHLKGAKFRKSLLAFARFDHARLTSARFTDARLNNSSFAGACLKNARFQRAKLKGANFSGALLVGADFRGATFSRTTQFASAHLKGATFPKAALPLLSKAQRRVIAAK